MKNFFFLAFLGAMMNSFVHVLMYAYYALAAAYPNKNFWWKKYMTTLQLVSDCFESFLVKILTL